MGCHVMLPGTTTVSESKMHQITFRFDCTSNMLLDNVIGKQTDKYAQNKVLLPVLALL